MAASVPDPRSMAESASVRSCGRCAASGAHRRCGGPRRRGARSDGGGSLVGGGPELGRLAREIDLDQDLGCRTAVGCGGIDLLQQFDRVNRMVAMKCRGGLLRLVRLQVANKMPPYLNVGCFADFLQAFLDLVFAEIHLAGGGGGADGIGAARFGSG